ncbi:unnamed protein product [Eruca vesicaria subsp. sativa]|uniref:Uncharacterized protein n=1 Tax=Eruca vesicaria subsp. sativa TaxID=29727 RepID=A0ABC8K832_ERUVS|nr:unnamed protein product [Eruca vesicaria subsp. sativa]
MGDGGIKTVLRIKEDITVRARKKCMMNKTPKRLRCLKEGTRELQHTIAIAELRKEAHDTEDPEGNSPEAILKKKGTYLLVAKEEKEYL